MNQKQPLLTRIFTLLHFLGVYFIALVLMAFAVSKFFNMQFQVMNYAGYMPLNETSLFNHAWSFFGRSYNYNLFLGIVEFLTGVLLVFPRTRLAGLLLAFGLYTNILIIDIEFQVMDALGHVIIESIIVVLLLIPYLKKVKKFLWERDQNAAIPKRIWSTYFPLGFLLVLTVGLLIEMKMLIAEQDPNMGSYKINYFILNKDTMEIKGGKYTREPMLFIEFGNALVISAYEKNNGAMYSRNGDSININFIKDLQGIKSLNGVMDMKAGNISGTTDEGKSFQLTFSKIVPGGSGR